MQKMSMKFHRILTRSKRIEKNTSNENQLNRMKLLQNWSELLSIHSNWTSYDEITLKLIEFFQPVSRP
jgi:hypothetical protein